MNLWESGILLLIVVVSAASVVFTRLWIRHKLDKYTAYGTCIRGSDGEVYLHMTEHAQEVLADPKTEMLVLRVKDADTRKIQPL